MSIQELEKRIENAEYSEKENIVNALSIEECVQILNGENVIAQYGVIERKYSIDDIKYLSEKIGSYELHKIIDNFEIKSKKDLEGLLSLSNFSKEDKDKIFLDKVFSLPEEDIVSFIDNYNEIDDEKLRIKYITTISPTQQQYLIKNSKYGSNFAKVYLENIDYDISLETDELYNMCLEKIAESLNINKEEVKYYISILGQKNEKILSSIDYKMLAPEFRQLYSLDRTDRITNTDRLCSSKLIQNSITNFGTTPEKIEVLRELFEYINNNYSDNWEAYVYLITSSFEPNSDFFDSLKLSNNGKILNDSDIKKLMAYCSIPERKYKISDITDLINIDKKRSEYVSNTFNNPNANQREMQNVLLEKKYGITLEYAEKFINRFNLEGITTNLSLKEMVDDIKRILKMNNQELRDYEKQVSLGEIVNIIDLQKELKNNYEEEYEKQLFHPSENNYMTTDEGIKIYNAGVDFAMLTHSVGAIYQKQGNTDAEHWRRGSIGLDSFSASFIRNDSLGFCNIRTSVYGFSSLDPDWLSDMSDTDYNSGPAFANGLSQSILNKRVHGKRLSPDEMIRSTGNMHGYNEFLINKYSNGETIRPDYIVFPCDDFEKDIESGEKLTGCQYSGKIAYQNALKAAKEFGIPIVVIERNKVLINEKSKIEMAKQKLYNMEEPPNSEEIKNCIENIITRYRTNFLGMSTFGEVVKTTEKYKETGISLDNYIKDCNAILEYAKYLEAIDEKLSKIVLDCFKDAITHPPYIKQLNNGIDEEIRQKYQEVLNSEQERIR